MFNPYHEDEEFGNLTEKSNICKKAVDLSDYAIVSDGYINPFNKNNKPITSNWIQNLLKRFGVYQNINSLDLYQQAFIHESYSIEHIKKVCLRDNVQIKENPDGCMLLGEDSYEILEFRGDTIIDSIMGNYICDRYSINKTSRNEGFYSTLKKQLISRWTLSDLAKVCGFQEYIVLSKTLDDKQNAREDLKKLCDVFEAFIGAIYIDFNSRTGNGYQMCQTFIINLLEHPDSLIDFSDLVYDEKNYKNRVRNFFKRTKKVDVRYQTKLINYRIFTNIINLKKKVLDEHDETYSNFIEDYFPIKFIQQREKLKTENNNYPKLKYIFDDLQQQSNNELKEFYYSYIYYVRNNEYFICEGIGLTRINAEHNAAQNYLQKEGLI